MASDRDNSNTKKEDLPPIPSGKERRKYPRVLFEDSLVPSLNVAIEGFGESLVFDMSFSGAALAQPKKAQVPVDTKTVTVSVQGRGASIAHEIPCRVIRATDRILALEFIEVSAEARLVIDQLISDRVIGLNMNLIDPQHYSPSASFTYWFHGPKETNLFLWEMAGGEVEKAQFDLNDVVLLYEDDSFLYERKTDGVVMSSIRPRDVLQKAISVLSQMETNLDPLLTFRGLLEKQIQV